MSETLAICAWSLLLEVGSAALAAAKDGGCQISARSRQ